MIASFSNDFIFIKTRKVGGTSLEIVLSAWCSGKDICSALPPADEEIRERYGGTVRNNFAADGSVRFYNHLSAAEIRAKLPKLWERAYTFTVERHPYEKVVSRAWWEIGKPGDASELPLELEIDIAIESGSYLNHPLYYADGKLLVDEVWEYEEMWIRLAELAARLGKPTPLRPPRAKSNFRKDHRPAVEILSREQRRRIAEAAAIEFELLGYKP